ncbi:hypothetical protein BLSMQ_0521 [Brevibacterium aurantiacum]|uniref:Uncharacterized protein n=1 Tax=Brevibacterium aurantiacum TaxID=273384 RepID=A0A1D7VZP5_BREAU|nr:hypothetical protein BLSMQ_0521 [Brevibacterium aurantiacum]
MTVSRLFTGAEAVTAATFIAGFGPASYDSCDGQGRRI